MNNTIGVKVVKYNDELIPVWDLVFEDHKLYGLVAKKINSDDKLIPVDINNLIDLEWDIIKRELVEVTCKDYKAETRYKIGETVLVEIYLGGRDCRYEARIIDIEWILDGFRIIKSKKIDKEYPSLSRLFTDEEKQKTKYLKVNTLKPVYVLDNGEKVEFEHELALKIDYKDV